MITVSNILQNKGTYVWSIHPWATIYEALQFMAEKDVGALLVMDGERLVGIFSERDYARKVKLHGLSSMESRVEEIMSPEVVTINPQQEIQECMQIMTERHIRHLPVLDEGRVVGVVSIGDVVKAIISDQEFSIQQLEKYIKGGR